MVDLAVAFALLVLALFPLAYSFSYEQKVCRSYYFRAIAGEIVDGELEKVVAGDLKKYAEGANAFATKLKAATNLPPGKFILTRATGKMRLEWIPDHSGNGGRIMREVRL